MYTYFLTPNANARVQVAAAQFVFFGSLFVVQGTKTGAGEVNDAEEGLTAGDASVDGGSLRNHCIIRRSSLEELARTHRGPAVAD
jgi:hypothetical protein